ncbi:uroporphyrinogen III synthase [Marinobacter psychrophilus]|uniref:Uroporphyrinogen-III synthase n=1 Tax=Marinobacter psychrophilus TaxID=330734 RepID=A0A0H4I8R9_9GAMM|nr:uroporphyrinogen-III synthase [Marinobacter psychrophilus]AKO51447.1 uroporphyrinogen III synthase [Marinobacter psychrophilus]
MATRRPESALLPLAGRRILICRPQPEADRLAIAFQAAGAQAECLPLIDRAPLALSAEHQAHIQNLDLFQHIVAVSPYAARQLLEQVDAWWPQLPVGINWYGVGAGTAAELSRCGITARRPAQGWTSEALLALPPLQNLKNQRVLLARGGEGRDLLRNTLRQRGAQITVLPLYQRFCPQYSAAQLAHALDGFNPDAVITLSGGTLRNLVALCAKNDHNLYRKLLIVPVERVAEQAQAAGFIHPHVPAGLTDNNIVASVTERLTGQTVAL